ncbi:MAG TPA: hypothetical protein VIG36_09360 [Methylocystis sp.]
MGQVDELRAAAARLRAEADRLDALADEMEAVERRPHFVSIGECAERLGLAYPAMQKRVARAGVGRQIGGRTWVSREWLESQVAAQDVRSCGQIEAPRVY